MEAEQTPVRTAIMRIMSDMLDNPDEHGIYETGRFMDHIEQLLCDMMAAPEVCELSGSEAVFGLMAWLTTRNETTVLGPHQVVDIEIIERFIKTNHLKEPRESWHELLVHPSEPDLVEVSKSEQPDDAAEESVFDFVDVHADIKIDPDPDFPSVDAAEPKPFPFYIDLTVVGDIAALKIFSVDIENEIEPILDSDASSGLETTLGEPLVEGTLKQILEFIIKNGLHKKPKS